ncbi:GNAT family N-acetyltransferase [Ornithinibacillus contaminans]|uniref:GNAT family N-acetyltransferase n=1 Tax=Ornithinibacillus contaminans TaxID=694055 RepID=UPI00064DECE6|nr:GNAT family N-acetyltransferase [Ornithinibacillus contaminans]
MTIEIVKYDKSYAARVADMWNHSRDGWGGANTVDTEESIVNREANSTNIHTYLALEGEKVVGYCGFSEYRDDDGALYIPLLNVRDDYHGKKIGKKLLLTALQEAIDLKWPRLDLYTWPGNTKAVPLYKKCGFFWEDRDDTTHLMNFMPTVLHTEAVQDFFEDTSWYDMSTRKIVVEPDGRVENEFHYYEYTWEKANTSLRMEFERTGRGIRLIETDDYVISATVEQHPLVFGNQYDIRYSLQNKSGKPLHIDLTGVNDKNITFNFQESIDVTDSIELTGSFYVDSIQEEQDTFKTHPTVQTNVTINGKQAVFKTGILPKYPAQIKAILADELTFIGKENIFYLDIVNNFPEKVQYELEFPTSSLVQMATSTVQIEIGPKEKVSIPVPFTVTAHGYYYKKLAIKARKENGEEVHFEREIGIPLRAIGAQFHGEDEETIQLYNGQYFAELTKRGNSITTGRKKKESSIRILTPKLGKPYSEEFAKATPTAVTYMEDSGSIGLKATYELPAFPSIKVHVIVKLYGEGLVENYYEIDNLLDGSTTQPIWLNQSIYLNLEKAILPFRGAVVEMNDSIGNSYEYWDESLVTENWLFVNGIHEPIGMCWHPDTKIHFGNWYTYVEHDLGEIPGKSTIQTDPVYFSIGAFHDVETLRSYANQSFGTPKVQPVNHVSVSLENNNPFVQDETATVMVKDFKSNYLNGELELTITNAKTAAITGHVNREEQQTEWTTALSLENAPAVSVVTAKAALDASVHERQTIAIKQQNTDIKAEVLEEQGFDTWTIDNGIIQLKASPEFFPTLHSLTYQGHEWLDTSFPSLHPKLWWNPWSGGLWSGLGAIRPNSLMKEKSTAAFANVTDNKGNEWKGIKLTTLVKENKDYKGLTYHQYFLVLPGAPVLCHVSEINQKTGTFFQQKEWRNEAYFKPAQNIEDNWARVQDKQGDWTKIVAGKGENESIVDRNLLIGCADRKEQMQIITDSTNLPYTYINKQVLTSGHLEQITIPAGETQFTTPIFYLFNHDVIPVGAQIDLKGIRF